MGTGKGAEIISGELAGSGTTTGVPIRFIFADDIPQEESDLFAPGQGLSVIRHQHQAMLPCVSL